MLGISGVATKYLINTVTASPSDEGLPSCVISTINADRDKDHVIPEGMDASNFMKAPVLMWSHGAADGYRALPIGTVTSLNVTPGQSITAEWKWLDGDPWAERVKNAWEQGVVRGTSIGFRPIKMEPNVQGGMDHLAWELLELSVCPIPANPEAVRMLKTLGLMDEPTQEHPNMPQPSTEIERAYVAGLSRDQVDSVVKVFCENNNFGVATRGLIEAVWKRGRVVSAVNESRLRAAMDALANAGAVLNEVLAQLMPMSEPDEADDAKPLMPEDMPPKKPMPMMVLDAAESYSFNLAEDALGSGGLRLVLADEPGDVHLFTLIDGAGREPVFTIDPDLMRTTISEAVKSQLQAVFVEPIGALIQRELNRARGRVE